MASVISIFLWIAISFAAQGLLYPYFATLLPSRSTAYGVTKVLGFTVIAYIVWIIGLVTGCDIFTITLIVFAVLVVLFIKNKWHESFESLLPAFEDIKTIEFLYFGTLFALWTQAAFHPEIFWGEKPMDFTFLNYFSRVN